VAVGVVFPCEGNPATFQREQPAIGDGHAMGVARQIFEDLLWSTEWSFGVNHPLALAGLRPPGVEGCRLGQSLQFTMKSKFALAECLPQVDEELLPKEAAENLYGKEERLVSKGNPTGTVFADPSAGITQ